MRNFVLSSGIVCSFLFLLSSCAITKGMFEPATDKKLIEFSKVLIGDYSSKKQSESDTSYFNISLSMTRIWPERKDAIWLYVEQAMSSKKDKPYRQRVYKLNHPSENVFTSEIYIIRNQDSIIGLQNNSSKRTLLTQNKIDLKDGCTVTLVYKDGEFKGSTEADKCPSELRGAKYATTNITLRKGLLISWDQGFDASGKQVWGATKGGYQFVKD